MRKVLLHICCGVCALSCIERLRQENFFVEGYFFNPNIHPEREYEKRKMMLEVVRQTQSVTVVEGEYDTKAWFACCERFYTEPEGGIRCSACFQLRLQQTYKLCKIKNYDYFTTTLTVSPYKKSSVIFELGKKLGGDKFLDIDFKKKEGFKRTQELSHKYKMYHQNYCGCLYSIRSG